MYGKRWNWDEEQRKNVSGTNHHGYGKSWTKAQRAKRENSGYFWSSKKRPYAPRNYDFQGGKNPNAKPVVTPNGKFGTLKEAARSHGVGTDKIKAMITSNPTEYYYLNDRH
jgi:hypothetical protein